MSDHIADPMKACPFCGFDDIECCKTQVFWYRCGMCGSETGHAKTKEGAADKWNNRPIEDALKNQIDECNLLLTIKRKRIKELEEQVKFIDGQREDFRE